MMERLAIKFQEIFDKSNFVYEMEIMLDGSGELGSTIRNSIDEKVKKFIIEELKKSSIKVEDFISYLKEESDKVRKLEYLANSDLELPFHPVYFPHLYSAVLELFEEVTEIEY